ncbi:MAG: inositol monophosphatase [Chloroflexi bacterium]|nr:inositol monophosphatase [Chloroflexota bacterium]
MNPSLSDIESLARGAGEILRRGYNRSHQVSKKGVIDLVTEIDHLSEAYLLGEIRQRFPGHHVLAEESGVSRGREEQAWFIDPLDGTVNYAHGVPLFCVSIAYAAGGTLQLGAVYDPLRDELFSAEKGCGATLNGDAIHVSSAEALQNCLLATGFPYDSWNSPRNNLDYFSRFTRLTQGVRRLGSAALDLCYVAAGRLDGYWELTLNPWDVAAGGLITTEAGGLVTDLEGKPEYITPPCSILAAPPAIHALMLQNLQSAA